MNLSTRRSSRLRDSDLPEDERQDALDDLDTVKRQLGKKNPNLAAVKAVASGLRDVNAITDLAEKLQGLLT